MRQVILDARAIPSPMPLVEPVTMALLPASNGALRGEGRTSILVVISCMGSILCSVQCIDCWRWLGQCASGHVEAHFRSQALDRRKRGDPGACVGGRGHAPGSRPADVREGGTASAGKPVLFVNRLTAASSSLIQLAVFCDR